MNSHFLIFSLIIVLAAAGFYDSIEQDPEDYHPRGSRLRRDYGCGVLSSNSYECNAQCRESFGCNWGQCEGFMRRFCRCRNADNSYC